MQYEPCFIIDHALYIYFTISVIAWSINFQLVNGVAEMIVYIDFILPTYSWRLRSSICNVRYTTISSAVIVFNSPRMIMASRVKSGRCGDPYLKLPVSYTPSTWLMVSCQDFCVSDLFWWIVTRSSNFSGIYPLQHSSSDRISHNYIVSEKTSDVNLYPYPPSYAFNHVVKSLHKSNNLTSPVHRTEREQWDWEIW